MMKRDMPVPCRHWHAQTRFFKLFPFPHQLNLSGFGHLLLWPRAERVADRTRQSSEAVHLS